MPDSKPRLKHPGPSLDASVRRANRLRKCTTGRWWEWAVLRQPMTLLLLPQPDSQPEQCSFGLRYWAARAPTSPNCRGGGVKFSSHLTFLQSSPRRKEKSFSFLSLLLPGASLDKKPSQAIEVGCCQPLLHHEALRLVLPLRFSLPLYPSRS